MPNRFALQSSRNSALYGSTTQLQDAHKSTTSHYCMFKFDPLPNPSEISLWCVTHEWIYQVVILTYKWNLAIANIADGGKMWQKVDRSVENIAMGSNIVHEFWVQRRKEKFKQFEIIMQIFSVDRKRDLVKIGFK